MIKHTIFGQLLQLIPRPVFETIAHKHYQGRKCTMNPWTQCMALLFGQLTGCDSLRHIVEVLDSQKGKYYHHGMNHVTKSSLGRANNKFSYKIAEELFQFLLEMCRKKAPGHRFKFKNKLYLFDSTTISLCLQLFDWAHFRQNKGAIKIHTQLDAAGHLPVFIHISDAKSHDKQKMHLMQLKEGDIVAFDRGYVWYKYFQVLDSKGVSFITRGKKNMSYRVLERQKYDRKKGIKCDQVITLSGQKAKGAPKRLRRIRYYDKATKKSYVFLTNNFKLAAATIAEIYRERWEIEKFFREIKQNLKIKTFVGTSKNAVMTQIYIALCAYLLLKLVAFGNQTSLTIGKMRRLLELVLFDRKCIAEVLFGKPPEQKTIIGQPQLQFA